MLAPREVDEYVLPTERRVIRFRRHWAEVVGEVLQAVVLFVLLALGAAFLPQNVVPVVSKKVNEKAADAIDSVNEKLTTDALIELNTKSTADKEKASTIAEDWLKAEGLL